MILGNVHKDSASGNIDDFPPLISPRKRGKKSHKRLPKRTKAQTSP